MFALRYLLLVALPLHARRLGEEGSPAASIWQYYLRIYNTNLKPF
jgi:hypothetical protein